MEAQNKSFINFPIQLIPQYDMLMQQPLAFQIF